MKIISRKLWSPQEFVEAFTGKRYLIDGDNDSISIHNILAEHGYPNLWDYMLDEMDKIPDNVHSGVLVDCLIWNESQGQFNHSYRWFYVPDEKVKDFTFKD